MTPRQRIKRQKEIAQWAEEYLNSEEGKAYKEKMNKEFKDYILFDKPTTYLNEELIREMDGFIKVKELSVEDIVKRFDLNEKETKDLIKLRDGKH